MTIIAVIIGYVLGIAPFFIFNLMNKGIAFKVKTTSESNDETKEVINEWLYGKKEEININKTNEGTQIYNEYTGVNNG